MISNRIFIFVLVPLQASLLFSAASSTQIQETIPNPTDTLQVFALPVGQGDCTIIRCPNGNIVVFDCGSSGGYGMSATEVQSWLGNAIDSVVAIIVSHADTDHNNYLPRIFNDHVLETSKGVIYGGEMEQYSDIMKLWFKAWEDLKNCIQSVPRTLNLVVASIIVL